MSISILKIPTQPERIKVFLNDPDKKPVFQCLYEFLELSFRKKEPAYYYFKHLYKQHIPNIKDYLSTNERARIHSDSQLNTYEYTSILENKLNFYFYFEQFDLPTPKLVGYNFLDRFYYEDKILKVKDIKGLIAFFYSLLSSKDRGELFLRPILGKGGKKCFKLNPQNLEETIINNSDALLTESYLYTEVIHQHREINKIHSPSVNSLRLLTLNSNHKSPELISAAIRFGVDDGVVDNLSSGGIFVGIDLESGTLKEYGWRDNPVDRGEVYTHHPRSGVYFKDFKIPYFKDAQELVVKAANYFPKTLIGWDIAIKKDGPIIIEGNNTPGLELSDLANEGLLKNIRFREFVNDVNSRSLHGFSLLA